ncbi:MAG: cytochrome c biogenesis protein CcsA, partial [Myxococcota bacterium]
MSAKHTQFPWLDVWLLTLSFGCLFTGLSMAFYYAPVLEYNGLPWWSQKIFYIHLPVAWGGLGGMSLVLISAIAYLKTRNKDWDALSVSASEVCFLYCTLVLCTGPIWGRPSW